MAFPRPVHLIVYTTLPLPPVPSHRTAPAPLRRNVTPLQHLLPLDSRLPYPLHRPRS